MRHGKGGLKQGEDRVIFAHPSGCCYALYGRFCFIKGVTGGYRDQVYSGDPDHQPVGYDARTEGADYGCSGLYYQAF